MSLKNSIIVLWVYLMYLLGIWLFFSGYLLKRIVIHKNSTHVLNVAHDITCGNYSSLNVIDEKFNVFPDNSEAVSPGLKKYNKSIVIIIDALRTDFAMYDDTLKENGFYRNQMKIFSDIEEKYPEHSFLSHLIADPPTTTLQRLGGITSGSLPTFIDIGLNFASASVQEDNLIWQLNNFKKKIVFLGDETWESAFPNQFYRSYPFPSFNVKDLDTVDNGILANVFNEMEKDDWDVIIAHFLGVDHCGHRYSPNHPAMTAKLQQMDNTIRSVIDQMPNDTILAVLGDHGMTETGDHGGDSVNEVNTVLFLYSHSHLLPLEKKNLIKGKPLQQIDFLPTLSLLLGLPIPFSNLGLTIPYLFSTQGFSSSGICFSEELDESIGAALALAENAYQVKQYLSDYTTVASDFSSTVLMQAEELLNNTNLLWKEISGDVNRSMDLLALISSGYQKYLKFVQEECNKKWAKFDIAMMALGSTVLCTAVFLNMLFAHNMTITITQLFTGIITILSATCALCFHTLYSVLCIVVLCIYFVFLRHHLKQMFLTLLKLVTFSNVVTFILFVSAFSNSFVVYEDLVVLFMLQSTMVFRFVPSICKFFFTSEKSKKTKPMSGENAYVMLVLLCLLLFIYRASFTFQKCREEQYFCVNSEFLTPLESVAGVSSSYQVLRLGLAWSAIVGPSVAFLLVCNYMLKAKNYTAAMICINYGLVFISVCICLHWWLMIVPSQVLDRILGQNQMILARVALVVSVMIWLCTWFFPLLAEKPLECPTNFLFAGSFTLFLFSLLFPLYLTAGEGLAMSIALMTLTLVIVLILDSKTSKNFEISQNISVVCWWLSSCLWFYGTGHQPTFPTIHWDSAFIISKDVVSYSLSAVFVTMNTFSSQIFHGAALPLLLIWSKPPKDPKGPLFRLVLKYLALHGCKLLASVLSCFLLRRHLMVWKIFTPKLIFEASAFLVTLISVCLGYVFLLRVTHCFHRQVKKSAGQLWFLKDD